MNYPAIMGYATDGLQFMVAIYALRLNRVFGVVRVGWSLFAAFALLALLHLFQSVTFFEGSMQHMVRIEMMYLLISLLLLTGMVHLETLLKERQRREREEQRIRGELETEVEKKTIYLTRAMEQLQAEIDEQKQLKAQLIEAQKLEALGQFAGGIAHDFNNILVAIVGYSELMKLQAAADSPLRVYAEEVRDAANRATALTQQLLVFSRRQVVQPVVLDLNEVVTSMNRMLGRLVGESVQMNIRPGENISRIKADPSQIGQVLMNLVVNARDAMPNGGRLTITTGTEMVKEDAKHPDLISGEHVVLTIQDTGTGMTEAVKARLFEPLFTTKPKGKGTGLGLITCKTIVEQCGGHIKVESELGKGTTFRVYFPQVDQPLADVVLPGQTGNLPRGTETVLVVEDDLNVRRLIQCVLEARGYNILLATDGQSGLKVAREHKGEPIRLVIADVVMPQMDGKAMADWMKATHPDIKIIFISGYEEEVIAQYGVVATGMAFMSKPFTPAALAGKVRELLDQPGTPETALEMAESR